MFCTDITNKDHKPYSKTGYNFVIYITVCIATCCLQHRVCDTFDISFYHVTFIKFSRFSKKLMAGGIRCIYGAEPDEISFLFFLKSVRCCGGIEALMSVKGGLQVGIRRFFLPDSLWSGSSLHGWDH